MADIKWSAFPSGGAIVAGDETVGLRAGANVRLTANTFGNLSLGTNTLSSTNSNGNINIVPNGTGVTTVGTSTSTGIGGTGSFIVAGTSVQPLIGQASYSNGSSGFSNVHNMYKSRGASVGSQVAVVSGDTIGSHQFYGSDGTNFLNAATIVGSVSGAVSAGIVPGQLVLRTATTLGAMTTAITISNAQVVTLAKALPVTSGGTGLTSTTANQLLYSSATSTIAGLATANNGLLVTSNAGAPSIGNAVGANVSFNGVVVGRYLDTTVALVGFNAMNTGTPGASSTAMGSSAAQNIQATALYTAAFGASALGAGALSGPGNTMIGRASGNVVSSGTYNTGIAFNAFLSLTTGSFNTGSGSSVGGAFASGSVELASGSYNTLSGFQASTDNAATIGAIALGANAVATIATGATSANAGPGIAIGSVTYPVGFRGNGTIYPSTTGAGFWRPKINGTYYNIPLLTDGATAWPAITTTSVTFSSTSGIAGTTTNNDAAAGSVGELILASLDVSTPISLTTATNADIASISLTAGDWDVEGLIGFSSGATTNITQLFAWSSSTSATLPASTLYVKQQSPTGGVVVGATTQSFTIPFVRLSFASTTTVYLSARASFTLDTLSAYGRIQARRRR